MRGLELIWIVLKGAPWSLREYTHFTVREIVIENTRCRCHSVACGNCTKYVDHQSDLTKKSFHEADGLYGQQKYAKKKKKASKNLSKTKFLWYFSELISLQGNNDYKPLNKLLFLLLIILSSIRH